MPSVVDRPNRALLVAGLGIFMVFLDTQILFVAFADIQTSFPEVSTTAMSWVLSGYTLVFAALLVPAGRLADRWGRRSVFLSGIVLFTVASAACGLAPSAGLLIVARLVQAVGAAAITPTSLALVLRATPKERIPIAVAVWGSMAAVAAAFGPTIGGLLIHGAGWRWVFFVNVPVCVVAFVAGRRVLAESREADPGPFPDLVGSALLALGVGAISLALVQSDAWGWASAKTMGAVVAGLALTAAFVLRSQRRAAPALDLSLFRIPSFRWGNLATAAFGLSFTGMFLANVTYLTSVWHWDIVEAGIAMSPGPLVVLVLARRFGRLAARVGPRPLIIAGGLVYAAGGILLVATVDPTPNYWTSMLPAWMLTGLGVALALPQLSSASVQGLPPDRYALGSAVNQTMRQLGATFGVALVVSFIAGATGPDALSHYQRAWWMIIACGAATSIIALALPRVVRLGAGAAVDAAPVAV
ncbi:MAG: DHA2 family efflux MFS transporter permease subunit [Ilumatobacteraceae bacterium]